MNSNVTYLFSGISTRGATGSLSVVGQDRFTVSLQGQSFDALAASGKVDVQARIDNGMPYVNVYSLTFGGNSGVLFNYEYPIESIRVILNNGSPVPTGTFTAAVRYSSSKD